MLTNLLIVQTFEDIDCTFLSLHPSYDFTYGNCCTVDPAPSKSVLPVHVLLRKSMKVWVLVPHALKTGTSKY